MEYMLTFHILNVYVDKNQPRQFKFTFNINIYNYVTHYMYTAYMLGRNKGILYCIVLYCIVLYCIVLYCIVLYCIVHQTYLELEITSSRLVLCYDSSFNIWTALSIRNKLLLSWADNSKIWLVVEPDITYYTFGSMNSTTIFFPAFIVPLKSLCFTLFILLTPTMLLCRA